MTVYLGSTQVYESFRGVLITHKSGFGYFYGSSVRQFYCSAVLNVYKKVKNCFKQAGTAEQRNRKTEEQRKFVPTKVVGNRYP